jgi:fatty acid desaturase
LSFFRKPNAGAGVLIAMNASIAPIEKVRRESRQHRVNSTAFQSIVLLLALTQVALGFAVSRGWFWLAVPLVLVVAHFMHGMLIGYHEASHGLLRRSRHLNEFDGVLIGVFSLLPFSLYRFVHQSHHMHLATEKDEEFWPLVSTETPRWARRLAAFLELNFGLFVTPMIFLRAFLRAGSRVRSRKVRRRVWAEMGLSVMIWAAIVSIVAWLDAWKYFLWLYLAPAFLAANLQSWRKYIEHVGMTGETVNGSTRSIVAESWVGRVVAFTLLHEPFHGIHHQHAGLPHGVLPQYKTLLAPTRPDEKVPFLSYRQALPELLRSLADPRFGPQWRPRSEEQRPGANAGALVAGR